jgi:2-methylfumaryl-CoA hydratase
VNIRKPTYGRVLSQFREGAIHAHPRGLTVHTGLAQDFAATFHEANPLYLNREYARAHGFDDLVVSPWLVLNLALSMGVQNNSEQAIAHLGYTDVRPLRPVHPGDTLRSWSKVLGVRDRGEGKPGVVTLRTICLNQKQEMVLRYDRAVLIPSTPPAGDSMVDEADVPFPGGEGAEPQLPPVQPFYPPGLTGRRTYAEDFTADEVIIHASGRTVSDEHMPWTYRVLNTHPLHFDRVYSSGRGGKMSGEPIVYGGLVLSWVLGLASRDVSENALWEIQLDQGYHTQPLFAGDTITALTRVEKVETHAGPHQVASVSVRHVAFRNTHPEDVLEDHGEDVFIREGEKRKLGKEKIPEKIFEIDRTLLVKTRP